MKDLVNSKNKRKSVVKRSKELFAKDLKTTKNLLPKHYGILLKQHFPDIEMRKVYNVVNYGIQHEDILEKLKFLVPSKN